MLNFKKYLNSNKILYIMRGISGSGKSTLAKKLAGPEGHIFSTDDLFMVDGEYKFNPGKLGEYHKKNFENAEKAMQLGLTPIVIDNTNTKAWEMKKYVEAGVKHGYKIEIKEPNTSWKFDAKELAKKNTHGVPEEIIQNMINRWDHNLTVDDILNSK